MGGMWTRIRVTLAILLFGVLLAFRAGLAQEEAFHQRFDTVLTQHRIVGGGIAIVHAQEPATQYFFGLMRNGAGQRVDGATSYNWASITKTMTAIAILQLRDHGQISLDDPAVRYVPELRQVHDDFGAVDAITIRDLLTHSAGFRNPTWPWDCDDPHQLRLAAV
jgi:CubicO group peptidase (beta-lactamase class C family)